MYVADKLMRTAGSRILIIARKRHAKSKKQESTVHLQCTEFIWVKTILFYKHKQLFHFLFCCVGLVVLIRIKFRVRVMVRVRVKVRDRVKIRVRVTVRDNITAGGGDGGLVWFGTMTFALGEAVMRINWTATYWRPLNCSCTPILCIYCYIN